MPIVGSRSKFGRVNKTRFKKKKKVKRAISNGKSLMVQLYQPITPLGPVVKKHVYHQSNLAGLNTGVTLATNYLFSANGLTAPNITGSGHQASGFDQMIALYEHYSVFKSKCTAIFYSADVNDYIMCNLMINPSNTVSTDIDTLIENGNGKRAVMMPGIYSADTSVRQLTLSCDIAKYNSVKDVRNDTVYQGDSTSNPAEQAYYVLSAYSPTSANVCGYFVEVFIEYYAYWAEPRKLPPS